MKIETIDSSRIPPPSPTRKGKYRELYEAIASLQDGKALHLQFADAGEKKRTANSLFARQRRCKLPITIIGTKKDNTLELWIKAGKRREAGERAR